MSAEFDGSDVSFYISLLLGKLCPNTVGQWYFILISITIQSPNGWSSIFCCWLSVLLCDSKIILTLTLSCSALSQKWEERSWNMLICSSNLLSVIPALIPNLYFCFWSLRGGLQGWKISSDFFQVKKKKKCKSILYKAAQIEHYQRWGSKGQ